MSIDLMRKWLYSDKDKTQTLPRINNYRREFADDITLLANTPAQAESLLHCLEKAADGIGLHVNAGKTEYMNLNQNKKGSVSILKDGSLKRVDKFTYLGSSVSSTENDINTHLAKAWTAIVRLLVIWRSDLSDEIKRNFFQTVVVSILVNRCTSQTLTIGREKKLVGNYTRMLQAVMNKSWQQHPTKQQLYSHLPPIYKTIQIRRTRHAGHGRISKNELISDILL